MEAGPSSDPKRCASDPSPVDRAALVEAFDGAARLTFRTHHCHGDADERELGQPAAVLLMLDPAACASEMSLAALLDDILSATTQPTFIVVPSNAADEDAAVLQAAAEQASLPPCIMLSGGDEADAIATAVLTDLSELAEDAARLVAA